MDELSEANSAGNWSNPYLAFFQNSGDQLFQEVAGEAEGQGEDEASEESEGDGDSEAGTSKKSPTPVALPQSRTLPIRVLRKPAATRRPAGAS